MSAAHTTRRMSSTRDGPSSPEPWTYTSPAQAGTMTIHPAMPADNRAARSRSVPAPRLRHSGAGLLEPDDPRERDAPPCERNRAQQCMTRSQPGHCVPASHSNSTDTATTSGNTVPCGGAAASSCEPTRRRTRRDHDDREEKPQSYRLAGRGRSGGIPPRPAPRRLRCEPLAGEANHRRSRRPSVQLIRVSTTCSEVRPKRR